MLFYVGGQIIDYLDDSSSNCNMKCQTKLIWISYYCQDLYLNALTREICASLVEYKILRLAFHNVKPRGV